MARHANCRPACCRHEVLLPLEQVPIFFRGRGRGVRTATDCLSSLSPSQPLHLSSAPFRLHITLRRMSYQDDPLPGSSTAPAQGPYSLSPSPPPTSLYPLHVGDSTSGLHSEASSLVEYYRPGGRSASAPPAVYPSTYDQHGGTPYGTRQASLQHSNRILPAGSPSHASTSTATYEGDPGDGTSHASTGASLLPQQFAGNGHVLYPSITLSEQPASAYVTEREAENLSGFPADVISPPASTVSSVASTPYADMMALPPPLAAPQPEHIHTEPSGAQVYSSEQFVPPPPLPDNSQYSTTPSQFPPHHQPHHLPPSSSPPRVPPPGDGQLYANLVGPSAATFPSAAHLPRTQQPPYARLTPSTYPLSPPTSHHPHHPPVYPPRPPSAPSRKRDQTVEQLAQTVEQAAARTAVATLKALQKTAKKVEKHYGQK